MRFLDLPTSQRIAVMKEDRNPDYIYEVINKHLNLGIPELKKRYDIRCDFIMNRIFIKGDMTDISDLYFYLARFSLPFESITQTELRIDMYIFIQTIL